MTNKSLHTIHGQQFECVDQERGSTFLHETNHDLTATVHYVHGERWAASNGHMIGPTFHYDVIDFVFAPRSNEHNINDVIMTSRSYHVTSRSSSFV